MSNPIEILTPAVWFAIEENTVMNSILNDIEKSKISREGVLSTNQRGNLLNKILYQEYE